MSPRPILRLDSNSSETTEPEPDGPFESTPGSTTDTRHLLPAKVKPGPLPLPFSTCSQAQFLLLEHSPHVHFPPTPALVRPGITHSSSTYDRAPIKVSPNQCEMPARGCRVYEAGCGNGTIRNGVVYTPGPGRRPRSMTQVIKTNDEGVDSYFDPRAFEACQRAVASFGKEKGEVEIDGDLKAYHMPRSAIDISRSSLSSSSSSDSDSEPEESTHQSQAQEIHTPPLHHDSFVHPPSPAARLSAFTLLPNPYSYPIQSASSRLRKKRSTSPCRGRRRKFPSPRSRSIDGHTYTRWSLDVNNGTDICKTLGDMSISDPSLDGCLGGF